MKLDASCSDVSNLSKLGYTWLKRYS